MAIALDSTVSGAVTNLSALTLAATATAGSTGLLFVTSVTNGTTGTDSITATYDGVSMPRIGSTINAGAYASTYYVHTAVFKIDSAPGGSKTVAIAATGTVSGLYSTFISYTGVGSVGSLQSTAVLSNVNMTHTVTSAPNNVVAQCFVSPIATLISNYGKNQRGYPEGRMMVGDTAGASSVLFSATSNNAAYWSVAVDLTPAAITQSSVAPAFDAQQLLYSGTSGTSSVTQAFTAASGADVFVAISTNTSVSRTLSSVAYGGVAMTLVGQVGHGGGFPGTYGNTYLYRSAGGGSGAAKNVTYSFSATTQQVGNIFSYTGVASVGVAATLFATSASPSIGPTSCNSGDLIIGVIGNGTGINASYVTATSPTGACRYTLNAASNYGYIAAPFESTTSGTTFGSTSSASVGWGAIAVVLSPSGSVTPTNQFFQLF